jgi:tetratricopeptide (TPR) repeat protein
MAHPWGRSKVLIAIGNIHMDQGRRAEAHAAYTEALAIYKQDGNRLEEANILLTLGQLHADADATLAKDFFYQASEAYKAIGLEEQARVAFEKLSNIP